MRVIFLCFLISFSLAVDPTLVSLTDATKDGAVCLDGTPPGYYVRPGIGAGSTKYIIHHEGGGWCYDQDDCLARASSTLGSSSDWKSDLDQSNLCCSSGGILNDNPLENPHFWNWTLIFIGYCDGSSFSSNVADPVVVGSSTIYFRGARILQAVAESLLSNGLAQASEVIITGCSAGGLSTYLHLDQWREWIPSTIPVHGLADGGYFLDYTAVSGQTVYATQMQGAFQMFNASGGVNQNCISAYGTADAWQCYMAQYTYPFIKTPLFTLNSKYDTWQLSNVLGLTCVPWTSGSPLANCSTSDKEAFIQFGRALQTSMLQVLNNPQNGIWASACVQHCQSEYSGGVPNLPWLNLNISNTSPYQAFYNWYYGSGQGQFLDVCDYPCNPSCPPS